MPSTELLTLTVHCDVEPSRTGLATLCPNAEREHICPMTGTTVCDTTEEQQRRCPAC
jgi:hypothetical protein